MSFDSAKGLWHIMGAQDGQGGGTPPHMQSIPLPTVVEHTARGHEQWDIFSRLLKERIVFLGWPIGPAVANSVIAQLLFLEKENFDDPISIYINSSGGSIPAGLAIYDVMQYVNPPIHTYCVGHAASMAAVLLASGDHGHRYALANSEVLIHQPLAFVEGWSQATDLEIEARHILRLRDRLNSILAHHTGKTLDDISRDTERDNWMSAEEAITYGLLDEIMTRAPKDDSGSEGS